MRDFIDAILTTIAASSLTDEEYSEYITITSQTYTAALYTEILLVLDSREAVSNTRDRLKYFFQARGVEVTTATVARSQIYLGADLCS